MERKIIVGITQGDTNGIGYEVIFKALAESAMLDLCTPVIYGNPRVAAYHRKALDLQVNYGTIETVSEARDNQINLLTVDDSEVKIEFGQSTPEAGQQAFLALDRALADYREGLIDVLVTAPINKHSIQCEGFHFAGHTEYIQDAVGDGQQALMILMNNIVKVALVTTHLPIREVADAITTDAILDKVRILNTTLKRDFCLSKPRIAVLSLNPHAGDDGLLGKEEQEVITPAIQQAAQEGILCFGPYPADGFFGARSYAHYDGVLAMYHDQGLAAFKVLAMDDGVNYTAGLPIVRTSPDHGTAYDIAGQNKADENSMRQAIYTAIDVVRNRAFYDEAHQNPLPKLFQEHADRRA